MTTEVERKFLVRDLPADITEATGSRLQQGYLASEGDIEVRLRRRDDGAWLTVKAGQGLVRTEVELPVDLADADALWPHTAGRRVEKTRYRVAVGPHVADLDVYGGELEGLVIVEVEFADAVDARQFAPPLWFGAEVTGQPAWSNSSLARHGRPRD